MNIRESDGYYYRKSEVQRLPIELPSSPEEEVSSQPQIKERAKVIFKKMQEAPRLSRFKEKVRSTRIQTDSNLSSDAKGKIATGLAAAAIGISAISNPFISDESNERPKDPVTSQFSQTFDRDEDSSVTPSPESKSPKPPVAAELPKAPVEPQSDSKVISFNGSVVDYAQKLADQLALGDGEYDELMQNVSNGSGYTVYETGSREGQYWCTYLVFDAYHMAGIDIPKNEAVVNMRQWWKDASEVSDFKYVDYQNSPQSLKDVRPGYAMMMEKYPGEFRQKEHVALVKDISVDDSGNGSIVTLEANSTAKSKSLPVSNWQVEGTPFPVRGFGGK